MPDGLNISGSESVPTPASTATATKTDTATTTTATPEVKASETTATDPRLVELAKQTRMLSVDKRRLSEERKRLDADKAARAAELAELAEYKKLKELSKTDIGSFQKHFYGEGWQSSLADFQINGTPPAQLVASAVEEKVSALKKEFEGKLEQQSKALQERENAAAVAAKADYEKRAIEFVTQALDTYPNIKCYGAANLIPQQIEQHFNQTRKRNPETGEVSEGEIWTPKQAAEHLEKNLEEMYQKRKKLEAEAATTQREVQPAQRRTLSTDLTATSRTNGTPSRGYDPKEMLARATAAAEASMRQRGKLS